MGIIALALTGCKGEKAVEQPWVVDRFDDIKILRYEVPEFENQSLNDKLLIYYLAESAKCGRDILFDQNFKYNLTIRRALEKIYTSYDGCKECPDFKAMEKYLKKVWLANGIHHHYSNDKFQPEFSREWFSAQWDKYAVESPVEKETILEAIFNPELYATRLNQAAGADVIATSAGNYYAEKIDDANFRIMGNKTYDFYLYFISDPALLSAEYADRFPKKGIYVTVNDAGTANIRNFKAGFVAVAQLKRNYIPDSIARTDDVVSRQQLAADAGKALVIGEDGVVKAGEVGGGGSLIVTITENDDGTFTPSHTSQEIYEAYMGGKNVTAIVNSNADTIYDLRACFDGYACFEYVYAHEDGAQGNVGFDIEGNNATYYENHYESSPMTPASATEDGLPGLVPAPAAGQQDMVLYGDGTWRAVEGGGSGEGNDSGVLYVTLTPITGTTFYTPSHTSAEIYAAHESGKYVYTRIEETVDGTTTSVVLGLNICNDEMALFTAESALTADTTSILVLYDAAVYSYVSTEMKGATADQNGHQGAVPAPAKGQQDMVLHGDGTWRAVEGGGCSAEGYDVFYRYTAEEDLTEGFEITAIDGETIAYKEIFVRLRLANKTDAKVTPYVKILTDWGGNHDFHPRWNWSSVDPNSEIVICAEAKLLGNGVGYCDWHWYTHAQVLYQNGGNYRRVQNPSSKLNANQESMFDFIKYNVIKGVWCNTALSAGTDIEIWGKKL